MVEIKFYNTLSRKIEVFKSIEKGVVKVYSCGPTVYSTPHIGNLRAAVFADVLKRILRYFDFKVIDVVNITDVGHLVSDEDDGEDKMLKASKKENKDPYEIAKYYENVYISNLKKLNIVMPKYMPRATEHIKEQLEIIEMLDKNGYTYETSDGVYFDVSKLKDYGKLSGQKLEDKKAGARVEVDSEKRNAADFALWKFITGDNENHIMKWDSKWGVGFPGWHIECSAMGRKYLGDKFDIHTGGIDHIPIHHENEIAQNEGSKCIKNINFWIHNAFMLVDSKKMSKSLGNVYNLADIIDKKINPLAFRLLCLQTNYRKEMNFSFESIEAAAKSLKKINEFYKYLENHNISSSYGGIGVKKYRKKFEEAIADDMNTSEAMASLFEFMNHVYSIEELSKEEVQDAIKFVKDVDSVVGLIEKSNVVSDEVIVLARMRSKAREKGDYKEADRFRREIQEAGYNIKDDKNSKEGFIIEKI